MLLTSSCGEEVVEGKDHVQLLNELTNICALCNDSTLGFNEVYNCTS